jgi:epoxyqueuosine reductase
MLDERSKKISPKIVAQAKGFGADLAGVARVDDLKRSPSHQISEKIPEFIGVGTRLAKGRKRGIVHWPAGARSAIVIGIEHPAEKPELDWLVTVGNSGNTAGNRLLIGIIDKLAEWLEREMGIQSFKLPYHIEYGAIYMKDAAVMAGLGCIGKNNLLVTPHYGPRQRLRVMLIDTDVPATGPIDFDPCRVCSMPCRDACPQQAFAEKVYSKAEYDIDALPGRTGAYSRIQCNLQMDINIANFEPIEMEGRNEVVRRVKYCRECEMVCPVGMEQG